MYIDIQLLKAKLKYHNKTYQEVAESIGMNRDTFARHLRKKDFCISHIHKMMKSIPLNVDEVIQIFFCVNKNEEDVII